MFERSAEMLSPEPKTESGYSEKETAKVIEGTQTDIKSQKKRTPVPSTSRKEKIIHAYKNNLNRIVILVESLSALDGTNHRHEEQMVEEIRSIRHLQEELLSALLLDQKGLLTQESISKEAWNLIQ